MEDDSTSVRKKYFKELPGGILPKNGNSKPDNENDNDEARVLLELEKQFERNHPPKLTPNARPYPQRRTYGITGPPNRPPARGVGRETDSPYGNYPRGMWGGMILFSVFMTFLVSWSPGVTLVWVAILTTFLLSLTECRIQARNVFRQTLLQLITFGYRKLVSEYPHDIQGGGEHGYESPSPECLKLNVTAKDKHHSYMQRKLAKQDALWNKDIGLLHITPERDDVEKATHFNFKVKCRINTDNYVVAEIDTDSHLNLISSKYFEKIKNQGGVMFLNEQPTEYSGLGSSLKSEYPPVMLSIQIGHCIIKARFIVSKELSSSPVLIGSDFLVKNEISVAPHRDGRWWLHVGPIDHPLGMMPVEVSDQLTF